MSVTGVPGCRLVCVNVPNALVVAVKLTAPAVLLMKVNDVTLALQPTTDKVSTKSADSQGRFETRA